MAMEVGVVGVVGFDVFLHAVSYVYTVTLSPKAGYGAVPCVHI